MYWGSATGSAIGDAKAGTVQMASASRHCTLGCIMLRFRRVQVKISNGKNMAGRTSF